MKDHHITIIGIAGGTGSGKTTVVKKIVEALPPNYVAVVPLDSYYNDTTGLTDEERKAINFDHPDAFDWKLLIEQVNELRHGRAVEQPTYSYLISNRLPETIHVEPKPVIIIEGIMTLINRKLRDMMDLKGVRRLRPRREAHTQYPARYHRPRAHGVDGCRQIPEGSQAYARAVHRAYQATCRHHNPAGRRERTRNFNSLQVHRGTDKEGLTA